MDSYNNRNVNNNDNDNYICLPPNPTRMEIDDFIVKYKNTDALKSIVREIYAKDNIGKGLHPCEEYLLELTESVFMFGAI